VTIAYQGTDRARPGVRRQLSVENRGQCYDAIRSYRDLQCGLPLALLNQGQPHRLGAHRHPRVDRRRVPVIIARIIKTIILPIVGGYTVLEKNVAARVRLMGVLILGTSPNALSRRRPDRRLAHRERIDDRPSSYLRYPHRHEKVPSGSVCGRTLDRMCRKEHPEQSPPAPTKRQVDTSRNH
jgi:hypothetical protein